MGGMHGFGAVSTHVETDEPVFHDEWEGRTFGLMLTTGAKGLTKGGLRPHIESMPPADYLRASYFERWAFAIERGLIDRGTLAAREIDERAARPATPAPTADPEFAATLVHALTNPIHQPTVAVTSRFAIGQTRHGAPDGARSPSPMSSLRARRRRHRHRDARWLAASPHAGAR